MNKTTITHENALALTLSVRQQEDLVRLCLTMKLSVYTLRIDEPAGIESDTKAAWLVPSTPCRRGRGHFKQHCAAGTRRDWHQGTFSTAYPIDCGEK